MTEVVLPTTGGCMRPWIWPNGELHIEPCSIDQLRLGDIAVWFDEERLHSHRVVELRAHRVVELRADALTTRGDSASTVDAPVRPRQLLGRAVRFTKGPISYRLDGPLVELLSRVGRAPWAKL